MAIDSDVKLTKYKTAVTVVTADFANSIFGGLHGSAEANDLDADDPRVRGHVHDGKQGDGHAPLVHLVEHVTDKLINDNLADDAVTKRNVLDTVNQGQAVPEYRIDGPKTYYYLDLRSVRSDFPFQEDEDPAGDGSQHKLIRQRLSTFDGSAYVDIPQVWDAGEGYDFVFGSSSLDDIDDDQSGDNRFQFDKSKAAFRAGTAQEDQWDDANRGDHSIAMGYNSKASEDYSTVSGGRESSATAQDSTVGGGQNNEASGVHSAISGGKNNNTYGVGSTVGGGFDNKASENRSTVSGGDSNEAQEDYSSVLGGLSNIASGRYSSILGGEDNITIGEHSTVGGGYSVEAKGEKSVVAGGESNVAEGLSSAVSGGVNNTADANYSAVSGGEDNRASGLHSNVSGGFDCKSEGEKSVVAGGESNVAAGISSVVSGGLDNAAAANYSTVSGGQLGVVTTDSEHATVGGGYFNTIDGQYSTVSGGDSNPIVGDKSTVSGGSTNSVTGDNSTISGGSTNSLTGDNSTISGGTGGILEADGAVITGGSGNQTGSNATLVSGGENNVIQPTSDYSSIVSGAGNEILGPDNHAAGAKNAIIEASGSTVIGGYDSHVILGSNYSFVIGTGKSRLDEFGATINENHTVGELYPSGALAPNDAAGSSLYSGILGGYNNKLSGGGRSGSVDPENNFIVAGSKHKLGGAVDGGGGIYDSLIAGGRGNEIGSYLGTVDPAGEIKIKNGMIIGGENNYILMGGVDKSGSSVFSSNVLYSGIIGGSGNSINYVDNTQPLAPWWSSKSAVDGSEYGVQTSYIFGGTRNSITNSSSEYFSDLSLYSSILGGQNNIISSSYGSTVLGGGRFVQTTGHGSPPAWEPLYDTVDNYYSNIIAKGHHSTILNGSSNLIRPYAFQFDGNGLTWAPGHPGGGGVILIPSPAFAVAEGRESYSYLYGQHSQAAGGHRQEKFQDNGFMIANMDLEPGATFKPMLGSFLNEINETVNQPGTAQASTMTFFGSWDYTPGEIDPSWNPSGSNYFEFRSYLDGGYDEALGSAERCFVPRFPASYNFTIKGALSFSVPTGYDYTESTNPTFGAEHHVISFTYAGYIVWQPSGSGLYGGTLTNVICSKSGVKLDLFDNSGTVPKKDFLIGFCPTEYYDSTLPMQTMSPPYVHEDDYTFFSDYGPLVSSARGSWEAPHLVASTHSGGAVAPTVWPPRFCIYVVNNSGNYAGGTGNELVGESLVAKADIVENLLFLGRYA